MGKKTLLLRTLIPIRKHEACENLYLLCLLVKRGAPLSGRLDLKKQLLSMLLDTTTGHDRVHCHWASHKSFWVKQVCCTMAAGTTMKLVLMLVLASGCVTAAQSANLGGACVLTLCGPHARVRLLAAAQKAAPATPPRPRTLRIARAIGG